MRLVHTKFFFFLFLREIEFSATYNVLEYVSVEYDDGPQRVLFAHAQTISARDAKFKHKTVIYIIHPVQYIDQCLPQAMTHFLPNKQKVCKLGFPLFPATKKKRFINNIVVNLYSLEHWLKRNLLIYMLLSRLQDIYLCCIDMVVIRTIYIDVHNL